MYELSDLSELSISNNDWWLVGLKSYRGCPKWKENGGMTSRTKALKIDADSCMEAVNCRACRRCPYCPRAKLKLWAEEKKSLSTSSSN